jgi:hypothetical protein
MLRLSQLVPERYCRAKGASRRDLRDYVIIVNEPHLKRLKHENVHHYYDDRTYLAFRHLILAS